MPLPSYLSRVVHVRRIPKSRRLRYTAPAALLLTGACARPVTLPESPCELLVSAPPTDIGWRLTAARGGPVEFRAVLPAEPSGARCELRVGVTDATVLRVDTISLATSADMRVALVAGQAGGTRLRVSIARSSTLRDVNVAVVDSATVSKVWAHRGAGVYAPENTLSAMRLAVALGAPGVEFDVRLTRDSVPILLHDATFARTTGYTGAVAGMSFAETQELNAAAYFPGDVDPEPPPSLRSVLDVLSRATGTTILIEIKHDYAFSYDEEARRVLADIAAAGVVERTIVHSTLGAALVALRQQSPTIRLALVADNYASWQPGFLSRNSVGYMMYPIPALTGDSAAAIDRLRQSGTSMIVYTARSIAQANDVARSYPGIVVLGDSVPALFTPLPTLTTGPVRR